MGQKKEWHFRQKKKKRMESPFDAISIKKKKKKKKHDEKLEYTSKYAIKQWGGATKRVIHCWKILVEHARGVYSRHISNPRRYHSDVLTRTEKD